MKKLNSKSDFNDHRTSFLLSEFKRALAEESSIAVNNIFKKTAQNPAPRFWVSEQRASVVIAKMLAGNDPTPSMYPEKGEMYREIFHRFKALRRLKPDEPIASLVFEIVNEPAPRHYLSPERIRTIIYAERRRKKNFEF